MANHKDNIIIINNSKTLIKRGQLLTSRLKLSEITGIQESKIERILKYLKSEQQIEQENLVIGRLITITNYNEYQIIEQQSEHGMNSERTANEQLVNTINNNNKENNITKEVVLPSFVPPEEWQRWIEHRKLQKKPMTYYAKHLAIIKLTKLHSEGHNPKEVIQNSIENNYQGLFPPFKKPIQQKNEFGY